MSTGTAAPVQTLTVRIEFDQDLLVAAMVRRTREVPVRVITRLGDGKLYDFDAHLSFQANGRNSYKFSGRFLRICNTWSVFTSDAHRIGMLVERSARLSGTCDAKLEGPLKLKAEMIVHPQAP